MEQQPTQTFRRNPFEIIGECFSIYGRHFRKLFLIALIIQVPLAVMEFALADSLPAVEDFQALMVTIAGDSQAGLSLADEELSELPEPLSGGEISGLLTTMVVYLIVNLILQTFLVGVFTHSVAMQYLTNRIDVGMSYRRAWWRVLTLLLIGLMYFCILTLMVAGFALFIVPGLVILALVIYWSAAPQVVVMEGYKPFSAMTRSFSLVRSNWLRTFATYLLILLVVFGLSVLLLLPLAGLAMATESLGFLARFLEALGNMLVSTIIAPLPGIASVLVYLNLKARNEDYDLNALSEQMGFTPPGSTTA